MVSVMTDKYIPSNRLLISQVIILLIDIILIVVFIFSICKIWKLLQNENKKMMYFLASFGMIALMGKIIFMTAFSVKLFEEEKKD